jgi:hypothetical protein
MTAVPCFLVTPLPLVRVGLRRYQGLHGGWNCGPRPRQRHEATVWLPDPEEQAVDDHRRTFSPETTARGPKPHVGSWPTVCEQTACTNDANPDHCARCRHPKNVHIGAITGACIVCKDGHVFEEHAGPYRFLLTDPATILHERLGKREDTGEEVLAYFAPVGAVVHLAYLAESLRAPDGRCLGVMTSEGLWYVDCPGRAGERWTRTGDGATLTTAQTAGPPWPWRIVEGMLEEVGRA